MNRNILLFFLSIFLILTFKTVAAQTASIIHINSYLKDIEKTPSWLLILRDKQSGAIFPYLYDFRHRENTWVALNWGHEYLITASNLQFDAKTMLTNFCGLQDKLLIRKTLYITLTGYLTPDLLTSHCYVKSYHS